MLQALVFLSIQGVFATSAASLLSHFSTSLLLEELQNRGNVQTDGRNELCNCERKRKKRSIFGKRLALPPGTVLMLTPTLSMPVVRHPPLGYLSNITVSLPFTIEFDDLGKTDERNPFGLLPWQIPYSLSREPYFPLNQLKSRPNAKRADLGRKPRAVRGGTRWTLLQTAENILSSFGMEGEGCVLRAVCEVHQFTLSHHGLVGELLEFVLSVSSDDDADAEHYADYLEAEKVGQLGDCSRYHQRCHKSLFSERSH